MSSAPTIELPAPVRPSPLIKTARWGLLVAGILYGISRQARLSKKEAILREIQAKEKAAQADSLAREKERLTKIELDDLARAAGITID